LVFETSSLSSFTSVALLFSDPSKGAFLEKTAKEAKVLRYQSYSEGWLSPVSFAPGKIMRQMPFFPQSFTEGSEGNKDRN
jgi:hypothetical protein